MKISELAKKSEDKENMIRFLKAMRNDLIENPTSWTNVSLEDFLEAMTGWLEDSDGYYENRGEKPPNIQDWRFFAELLSAARVYE